MKKVIFFVIGQILGVVIVAGMFYVYQKNIDTQEVSIDTEENITDIERPSETNITTSDENTLMVPNGIDENITTNETMPEIPSENDQRGDMGEAPGGRPDMNNNETIPEKPDVN